MYQYQCATIQYVPVYKIVDLRFPASDLDGTLSANIFESSFPSMLGANGHSGRRRANGWPTQHSVGCSRRERENSEALSTVWVKKFFKNGTPNFAGS